MTHQRDFFLLDPFGGAMDAMLDQLTFSTDLSVEKPARTVASVDATTTHAPLAVAVVPPQKSTNLVVETPAAPVQPVAAKTVPVKNAVR